MEKFFYKYDEILIKNIKIFLNKNYQLWRVNESKLGFGKEDAREQSHQFKWNTGFKQLLKINMKIHVHS